MHVSLTPELESFVRIKVGSGLYNNASEVVREALRSAYEDDELRKIKIERFKEAIAMGIDDVENGRFSKRNIDDIISDLEKQVK